MLIDESSFKAFESEMRESGKLEAFITENGEVSGRMMVTVGEPPADSEIEVGSDEAALIGSFDFMDCAMGIVFNPAARTPSSGIWVIRQSEDARPPQQRFIGMFAEKLMAGISEDGTLRMPVCALIAENGATLANV